MEGDDRWAMYYVVRKDRPLTLGQAMALGGAGAVTCFDRLAATERWREAFAAWSQRPRKVALRATPEEVDQLAGALDGVVLEDTVLCLPPRRMSERDELLAALRPYTDAPRPKEEPPAPEGWRITYAVRPGVMKTAGKALAQAGHAALACAREHTARHDAAFAAWRAAGCPGDVRLTPPERWEDLKAAVACTVVQDAGLTQVEPGTETVLALVPSDGPPDAVAELDRVP